MVDNQPYQFMSVNSNQVFSNIYEKQEYELKLVFRPHGLHVPSYGPSEPIERCQEVLGCGHDCAGCHDEELHLACLEPSCENFQLVNDNCMICKTKLNEKPSL